LKRTKHFELGGDKKQVCPCSMNVVVSILTIFSEAQPLHSSGFYCYWKVGSGRFVIDIGPLTLGMYWYEIACDLVVLVVNAVAGCNVC
jgi:hypothetical protein